MVIIIPATLYHEHIVFKCFYWYASDYSVEIDAVADSSIMVTIQPKNIHEDMSLLAEKVKTDLIDFKLREIVNRETRTIRELIIAKAFAYAGMIQNPSSIVTDPVGFDPSHVK